MFIWGGMILLQTIVPGLNPATLPRRIGWPVTILFVLAGIVKGLRIAYRIMHEDDVPLPPVGDETDDPS